MKKHTPLRSIFCLLLQVAGRTMKPHICVRTKSENFALWVELKYAEGVQYFLPEIVDFGGLSIYHTELKATFLVN